jgi:hypothetical protein
MIALQLEVLDCGVQIECIDESAHSLLQNAYGCFQRPIKQTRLFYHITPSLSGRVLMERRGGCPEFAGEPGDLLSKFDKDLIVETQKLRPDLYFVHAAVVAFRGHAIALVAPSGFGKSTTTWALLHHGFHYLSDEIAPIDPKTFRVFPFPRALCLKTEPPARYPLPPDAIVTGRTIHVPTGLLPGRIVTEPLSLNSIFFLRFIGKGKPPVLKRIGAADGTVRLFTNVLNLLAHQECGLDQAMAVVANARCYELLTADLRSTCELVKAACLQDSNHLEKQIEKSSL